MKLNPVEVYADELLAARLAHIRAYGLAYRDANRDYLNEGKRQYYLDNQRVLADEKRSWTRQHRDRVNARRRANWTGPYKARGNAGLAAMAPS